MFWHCRELRHVIYDKVGPAPEEVLCPFLVPAYRWLGHYCGYFPQVWLARSHSRMTGFRSRPRKRRDQTALFGFERIQGFPIDYMNWHLILNASLKDGQSLEEMNALIEKSVRWRSECGGKADALDLPVDPLKRTWRETGDLQAVFRKHLFVEHDQVVVPNLNLKAAKEIVVRCERDKKKLRRLGFIEDRIKIRKAFES
ncbi:MAG: hypothetical protein JKY65_18170 [Planctomycetes bacterium]|nr:hypothetical protein [Planctomycetota bacterium]